MAGYEYLSAVILEPEVSSGSEIGLINRLCAGAEPGGGRGIDPWMRRRAAGGCGHPAGHRELLQHDPL